MKITRRQGLGLGIGLGLAALMPAWAGEVASLDNLARRKGMRFGTALSLQGSQDPAYAALVKRECGLIVPESEMKWQALRPAPSQFDFAAADSLAQFASTGGLGLRGHTLLWVPPEWFPKWLESYDFGPRPATEAARLLTQHIATVCDRYGGQVTSFDVVNEAVDPVTGAYRENVFTKILGMETMIDIAFHTAREHAPKAELVYNDFMGWGQNGAHRDGVSRLLEKVMTKGTPIDALGLQSHLGGDGPGEDTDWVVNERAWTGFLSHATDMGLNLLITEMDVNDRRLPANIKARDRMVADYARRYLDLTLAFPELGTIMVWGLADPYSWLQKRGPRADGLPKRTTPYDRLLNPKPLRDAIAAAIDSAPARQLR